MTEDDETPSRVYSSVRHRVKDELAELLGDLTELSRGVSERLESVADTHSSDLPLLVASQHAHILSVLGKHSDIWKGLKVDVAGVEYGVEASHIDTRAALFGGVATVGPDGKMSQSALAAAAAAAGAARATRSPTVAGGGPRASPYRPAYARALQGSGSEELQSELAAAIARRRAANESKEMQSGQGRG